MLGVRAKMVIGLGVLFGVILAPKIIIKIFGGIGFRAALAPKIVIKIFGGMELGVEVIIVLFILTWVGFLSKQGFRVCWCLARDDDGWCRVFVLDDRIGCVVLYGDSRGPLKKGGAVSDKGLLFALSHKLHGCDDAVWHGELVPLLSGELSSCGEVENMLSTLGITCWC
jgi:hypothetical protein